MRAQATSFFLFCFFKFGVAIDPVSMTCQQVRASVPPNEWLHHHNSTPSDVYDLKAQLHVSEETQLPTLNITWILSPDGSIQALKATMICVASTETICFRCNYNATFKSPWNPQKQRWHFHYMDYPVNPATSYTVRAFNIPTSNVNEYAPEKSAEVETPGCDHVTMTSHIKCEDVHWKPNITSYLVNNDVVINFTTSAIAFEYDVKLFMCNKSFPPSLNRTIIPQKNGSRISITFVRNDVLDLSENICVRIRPYFSECYPSCKKHTVVLQHCKTNENKIASQVSGALKFEEKSNNATGYLIYIIGMCVILIILGVAVLLIKKFVTGKTNERILPTSVTEPLQPVNVLIIYAVDNELFQNVILAFADFLHRFNGIKVIIDIWQRRKIAEMGPAQWLVAQKEKADKIIIVISKSAKMKWDAICCKTITDQKLSYSEDMYSIALNIFCSDLQSNCNLHKYCIVYFDAICSAKDIPGIYSSCVKYRLGKDINKLFKNLHNSSHKVQSKWSLWPYSNYNILFNHKMKDVILKLIDWQKVQPTSNLFVNPVEDLELQCAEDLQIDIESTCP
ncbi:interleukin-17 receptor B isoform X1 [Mobula hypostoma]|uniref:interleukin-17 receptor B isoform X1 n=1 Tax=Mobula hypostoma TaxID=723540 RepID=UPI002FC32E03